MTKSFASNWMKAVARDAARAKREAEINRKRLLKAQAARRIYGRMTGGQLI